MLDSAKNGQGGALVGPVYVESTKSVRCDTLDKPRKRSGAYRLHELHLRDGIWLAGSYWVDHGNTSYKIELNKECADCGAVIPLKATTCPSCGSTKRHKAREIPQEELEAHRRRMLENKRQAEERARQEHQRASDWATLVWRACTPATLDGHDYFARKGLTETFGARIFPGNDGIMLDGAEEDDYRRLGQYVGALVLPLQDLDGKIWGLQFILSRDLHGELIRKLESDKMFWPSGLDADGKLYMIGGSPQGVGLVCEGFATGGSLRQASNLHVVLAWNAGNLPKVVDRLRKRYKRARLLVCADDDWLQRCPACQKYTPVESPTCAHCGEVHGKGNAGITKAREAAALQDVSWVAPVFAAARPDNRKGPTDFNDLAGLEGIQIVQAQIESKLDALGWGGDTPPPARNASSGGAGDGGGRNPAVSTMPLNELVERFIYVDDDTGDFAFDTWTNNVVKLSKVVKLLPARVRFDDVKDHVVWKSRAVYIDQIGFDPAGEDKNIKCNRWGGWPTTPAKGKCDSQLDLLRYLCGNEPNGAEIYRWMLCWMSYPIQNPGAKLKSAIVIHGPQGTGKSMVFESYAHIYGEYAMILNQGAIEDKFNADWSERKLFILADEIVARAEMHHLKNQLKNFITGEWVRVNPKNVAAHKERNHMNIVFSSNEDQPVVLENDDRRHLVIWTPPKLPPEYYAEVAAEIEQGGVAALHHYLLEYDIGDFKPWTLPPMTQAKQDLIAIGADSIERFLSDWQAGDLDEVPFCPCGSSDLYRVYLRWCRDNGEKYPRTSAQFLGRIKKRDGWHAGHKDRQVHINMPGTKRQRVVVPSVRALVDAATRGDDYRKRDGESETAWISRCWFDFNNAISIPQP